LSFQAVQLFFLLHVFCPTLYMSVACGIRSCLQKHRRPFNYISYQASRCSPAGGPLSFDSQDIYGLTTEEDLIEYSCKCNLMTIHHLLANPQTRLPLHSCYIHCIKCKITNSEIMHCESTFFHNFLNHHLWEYIIWWPIKLPVVIAHCTIT
jgi:hypothetical protein